MTAQELLAIAKEGRPEVKYVTNDKGDCIGAWSEKLGRYCVVAAKSITGEWVNMPYELLVNGKLLIEEWIDDDPEKKLRDLWTRKGVPKERQDEMIAETTAKAQPGAQVGPFTIPR